MLGKINRFLVTSVVMAPLVVLATLLLLFLERQFLGLRDLFSATVAYSYLASLSALFFACDEDLFPLSVWFYLFRPRESQAYTPPPEPMFTVIRQGKKSEVF